MVELIRSKMVVARKRHGCETCNAGAIEPGEAYERKTYVHDGNIYDWLQCGPCADLATNVWEWSDYPDEGVGLDDYVEWARENQDENQDARAYLGRLRTHSSDPSS